MGRFCSNFRGIQVLSKIVLFIVDRISVIWFLNLAEVGKEVHILQEFEVFVKLMLSHRLYGIF